MNIARHIVFVLLGLSLLSQCADWEAADWHRAFPPFNIAGNLYYVGTADLAVYLIATPHGNILINSDFPEDVPLIRKSIEQLGFRYADTRVLLISHAHSDHDGATAIIKQDTGAHLMAMDDDVQEEESTAARRPGAHVDRVLHDRDTMELGGSTLTAYLTPGHTKGCTAWTMDVSDGSSRACPPIYISERTVHTLGWKAKYERLKSAGANPFIDPAGYQAFVLDREAAFLREWNRQRQRLGSPAP